MASGQGAGLGADMLQEILRQKATEAFQNQQLAQERQRIALAEKAQQDATDLKRAQLQQYADAHAATEQGQRQLSADRLASNLTPGSALDASAIAQLKGGDLGSLVQHTDAVPTRNLSGAVQLTGSAPRIIGLSSTPNAGLAPTDTFAGTAAQHAADQARTDKIAAENQSRQDKIDAAKQAAAEKEHEIRLAASLRPAPQPPLVMVNTVDENGNPISKIVPKAAGASFAKPTSDTLDATTKNRLQSAKAVTQTGNDIVSMLSDPRVASQLGQAMSRYNSVADFIGNAPPEWSKLAGMIESYSLANMGVHGMRSSTGAEAIKQTLGQGRHTPESMIAAIQGLNGFAGHLLANNPKKDDTTAPGSAKAPANETPEQRIARLLGGG